MTKLSRKKVKLPEPAECDECYRIPCVCGEGPQNDDWLEAERQPLRPEDVMRDAMRFK